MTDTDQDLEKMARDAGAALRQQELDVPSEVAQRLQTARRLAVAQAESGTDPRRAWWPGIAGVGAAASAALLVAFVLQTPLATLPHMNDGELAAAQEAELLQELEFVAWMVAMEEANDLPNSG